MGEVTRGHLLLLSRIDLLFPLPPLSRYIEAMGHHIVLRHPDHLHDHHLGARILGNRRHRTPG